MSTELTTQDIGYNPLAFFGSEGDSILKPVRLELIQPISANPDEGTIAGRFRDAQSNSQFTELNLVVLEMRDGRVFFETKELGSKPLCRSVDGKNPVISDDLVRQDYGRGCAKCPMSQWKNVGGKKIRPPCAETKDTLVAELETGFPYRLKGKGQSIPVFSDLKATLTKFYLASKAKGMAVLPTQMFFKMSAVRVVGKLGTYYVPKFGPPQVIEDEEQLANIAAIHRNLVINRKVDYSDEDEVGPDTKSDPVAEVLAPHYEAA